MSNRLLLPSQDKVRERLDYDADTGILVWRSSPRLWNIGRRAGAKPGYDGYIRIYFSDYGTFTAHRLAWIHACGEFDYERFELDHINGVRSDNRLCNLRLASHTQNAINGKLRVDNSSGVKGVRLLTWGKFNARIKVDGREFSLGCFDTLEEAAAARKMGAQKVYGEFARETQQ